jgi:hypothetical protein
MFYKLSVFTFDKLFNLSVKNTFPEPESHLTYSLKNIALLLNF